MPFWCVYWVFRKCLRYVPQQKWQGFIKMLHADLSPLKVSCQVSQTLKTKTGRMEKVSESQEANWEEMPIWFWFRDKEAEMKGLQEKNPKSFHPSEPREQKRQNWYFISLLNSLFLRACMRVEKALLCSHSTLFMPRPQFFLFSRTVSKFQFHPFFKLLTFSTEAGVEELIHQSEAPRSIDYMCPCTRR